MFYQGKIAKSNWTKSLCWPLPTFRRKLRVQFLPFKLPSHYHSQREPSSQVSSWGAPWGCMLYPSLTTPREGSTHTAQPCAISMRRHKDSSYLNHGRSTWVKILPVCSFNWNFCFTDISLCFNNVLVLTDLYSPAMSLIG